MECCRFVCSSEEQRSVTLALNRPAGASRRPRYLRAISRDWQLLSPGTKLVQKTEITADRWRITGDKKQHQPCRHGDSSESHSGWKQMFSLRRIQKKTTKEIKMFDLLRIKECFSLQAEGKASCCHGYVQIRPNLRKWKLFRRTLWQLPGGSCCCTSKPRRSFHVGKPVWADPGSARWAPSSAGGRTETRWSQPRDAFCAVLWSVLYRILFNKNANFFSWPFCSCWFVSMKVVSMTTDALIKGNKVWAFKLRVFSIF